MKSFALMSLLATASAIQPPTIAGFELAYSDSFEGCAGCAPKDDWIIALDINTNNELQTYTTSNLNLQLSGGDTLQIVPWRDEQGEWTSARIESKETFMADPGKKMIVQSSFRLGDTGKQQGMWPAFWMLGDAIHHGTEWPLCGEIDIFEQVNGDGVVHGTVHCGTFPGGVCDEPNGIGSKTDMPDADFHTWSVTVDRTAATWEEETIVWQRDGAEFARMAGGQVDEGTWSTLAHAPFYILANIAVGGDFPGPVGTDTEDGYTSMMEMEYVAVYMSN